MFPKVAVVILNYNGEKHLQQFLPSVIKYSQGHRIIVADNASTDRSLVLLREAFPEVEVLELKENYGFAGGYNRALKFIDAKYYLLLNSDVEVTIGWLDPLLQLMESFPEIAACQPKIRAYQQPAYFEYAGGAGGFLDVLGYPFCRGRIFETLEEDKGQYNEIVPVFWASGACMFIRKKTFEEAGGFDASFFAHMEEIDLCWRIHRLGYKVYACPESTVYHLGGGTLAKNNPRKTFLNFRNSLWMLYKNSSTADLFWKLPLRLTLDLVAALQFILKGQQFNAGAVLKAQFAFWANLPERKEKKAKRKNNIPLYKGFILWDYYGKNRNKFSQLNFFQNDKGKIQKAL